MSKAIEPNDIICGLAEKAAYMRVARHLSYDQPISLTLTLDGDKKINMWIRKHKKELERDFNMTLTLKDAT